MHKVRKTFGRIEFLAVCKIFPFINISEYLFTLCKLIYKGNMKYKENTRWLEDMNVLGLC